MEIKKKVIKKMDCFMLVIEERHDLDIYTILKNLETVLIDLISYLEEMPPIRINNPDLESINYHSRSIELIVAKLDGENDNSDIKVWKDVYDEMIDMFNSRLSIEENSMEEEKLLNICDIVATIYTKFGIFKKEYKFGNKLFWTIKYGYETDWGEDIEYILEMLPGIRSLITTAE